MIKKQLLKDCRGAEKFGTCASCGKGSSEDEKMVRLRFSYQEGANSSICLCSGCLRKLASLALADANA